MKPLHCPPLRLRAVLSLLAAACMAGGVRAQDADALDIGLEDLLKVDVQTASRKSQQLRDVAAAAFVITRDDIERSGATTLPEALRLAPGIQVAQLANNRWAVTARGYNGRFANKLQVLIDGRSIYSPVFGGVMWELEETLLDDVARIEVLRGPAAAMWGANAVNGVINVITRHARDTQGTQATLGAGTQDRAFGSVRQGFRTGDNGYARVWAKGFYRASSKALDGSDGHDFWHQSQVGGRGDWTFDNRRRLSVSGAWFQNQRGEFMGLPDLTSPIGMNLVAADDPSFGGYLMARHEWMLSGGAEAALQAYVQRSDFTMGGSVRDSRTTYDLDFQHRLAPLPDHDLMWGVGLRYSVDTVPPGGFASLVPATAGFHLYNLFVQDEVTLVPDTLRATLGARLERNSYTGVEPQPNVRLIWTPNTQQSVWAAVSRAVRMPSRAEESATIDIGVVPASPPELPLPLLLRITAEGRVAERLNALDIGYRHEFGEFLSLDVAAYRNRYTRLRSVGLGSMTMLPGPPPHLVQTFVTGNAGAATITGLEFSADWRPLRALRVQANYTYMQVRTDPLPPEVDPMDAVGEVKGTAPSHQLMLRTAWNLNDDWRLDAWLRHVSALDGRASIGGVPAYNELNLRLGWRVNRQVELALVGQNLLHDQHREFVPDWVPSVPLTVQRAAYAKLKVQF